MKIRNLGVFSLVIASLGLSEVSGQHDVAGEEVPSDEVILESMPYQIGILVECLSADRALVESLLYQFREEPNDRALRRHLQGYLKRGKATVSELGFVMTRSGSQASIESVVEHIYPTEFDPPEMSQELRGPIAKDNQIASPATPTAFQTRNTGLSVKVNPQHGPELRLVDMDVAFNGVEFAGDDRLGEGLALVTMPRFYSRSAITKVTVASGEDVLLGVVPPSEGATERELIFVRPTLLPLTTVEEGRELWARAERPEQLDEDDPFATARPPNGSSNVVTTVEYLDVPVSELHELLRRPMKTADATALRRSLDPAIKAGSVKRTGLSYVPTRSGRRAVTRSGMERIYGVEADPPELPGKLQGPIEPGVELITPLHRTTFEMRPEGHSLEVDPQLGPDGRTIDLSIAPERVNRLGTLAYGQRQSKMTLPLFHTERLTTSASLLAGRYLLLGVHSTRSQAGQNTGRYTMVFVTSSLKGNR